MTFLVNGADRFLRSEVALNSNVPRIDYQVFAMVGGDTRYPLFQLQSEDDEECILFWYDKNGCIQVHTYVNSFVGLQSVFEAGPSFPPESF